MKTSNLYLMVCLLFLVLTAPTVQAQSYNTVTTSPAYKNDATTGNVYTVTLGNGGTVTFTVTATEGNSLSATGTFANTGDDSQNGAFTGSGLTLTKTVTWAANCSGWGQLNDCAITITHVDTGGTTCHGVLGASYPRGANHFPLASLGFGNNFLTSFAWNVAGFISNFRQLASFSLAGPSTPPHETQEIFKCKVRLLKSQTGA